MAFGIRIYEKDEYLRELIRQRLQNFYPEAYIVSGDGTGDLKFIRSVKLLYDNRQFTSPGQDAIPLFADDGKGHSIIDMKRIKKIIGDGGDCSAEPAIPDVSDGQDRLKLLVSYAYIDERENFIKAAIGPSSFDSMHPLRIDLMSGIRMPTPFTPGAAGSIASLLRACSDKKFDPSRITDFLNPDSNGFLSAGKPENEDDVFEIGIEACARLMALLKILCIKDEAGALVVAEGWRVSEITQLISYCDALHILLPARMCTEDTGMVKELGVFKRALPSGSLMTVHYCEDYRDKYESIRI